MGGTLGEAPLPGAEIPIHLQLDDADDAATGGRVGGVQGPAVDILLAARGEPGVHREAVGFAKKPGGVVSEAVLFERYRVEPAGVQVSADEHHRAITCDGVEHVAVRRIRPECVPEAGADDGLTGRMRVCPVADEPRHLSGARRARQVESARNLGPLREMHVVVPEARGQEFARELYDLDGGCIKGGRTQRRIDARRNHGDDEAFADVYVDGDGAAREERAAKQHWAGT